METSKETLFQIFNTLDKDQSGFIELEEINALATELGQELTEQEQKQVFQYLDTNGDGKISFEEFYFWWYYGKQNKFEKLVYYKFKNTKLLNKIEKKTSQKLGPFLEQKYEPGTSEHFISINIGDVQQSKTAIALELRGGLQHQEFLLNLSQLFPEINAGVSVYFWIKTINAKLVEEQLTTFINEGLELALTLVPEQFQEIAVMIKDTIKVETAINQDIVYLRLTCQHEIVETFTSMYTSLVKAFQQQDFKLNLKLKIESVIGTEEIINKIEEPLINLFNKGLKVSADLKVNQEYIQAIRDFLIAKIDKKLQADQGGKYLQKLRDPLLLTLLEQTKISVNFDSFDNLCNDLDFPQFMKFNTKSLLQQITNASDFKELLQGIPFVNDLIEILKANALCDFNLCVCTAADMSVTLHIKAENLSKLWEKIIQ